MIIKFYIEEPKAQGPINYAIGEVFRYLDGGFKIVEDHEEADVVYGLSSCKGSKAQLHITPRKEVWDAYLTVSNLNKIIESVVTDYEELTSGNGRSLNPSADIFFSIFFFLSGYEEYVSLREDSLGRFLARHSQIGKKIGFEIAHVDRLRDCLLILLNDSGFAVKARELSWEGEKAVAYVSHDVDGFLKYRNTSLSLLKIILKPNKFSLNELLRSKRDFTEDPYFAGVKQLCDASKERGFKSTFFLIPSSNQKLDDYYELDSAEILSARKIIDSYGYEIGIHGSYDAYESIESFKQDMKRFENIIKTVPVGGRQHLLSFNPQKTTKIHQEVGLKYDGSLGFSDMIGFRRGTSLPFYPYDFEKGEGHKVLQIPLLVMDVTLKNNMGLSEDDALERVNRIIDEVEKYGGVFSLLWHPGNCSDEWRGWFDGVYIPILNRLKELKFNSLSGREIHAIMDKL
jgi:hypothetical protein